MSNMTAFGEYIGRCDNCQRELYRGKSTLYYVRFMHDQYCFCDHCVTVVESMEGKANDEIERDH